MREGFASNTVTALCQDEFGLMWVGTQDGLYRYDGVNMDVYQPVPGDSTSIYSNNIKALCSDGAGNLFVISKFALSRYDFGSGRFSTLSKSDMQSVCASEGTVWAASSHQVHVVRNNSLELFCTLDQSAGRINALLKARKGSLLIGTSSGLYEADDQGKTSRLLDGIHVLNLFADSRRNVWVCTRRHGVICLSPDGTAMTLTAEKNGISGDYVRSVCEDIYGNFWIGTLYGVDIYDVGDSSVTPVEGGSIYSIFKDRQDNIWVASRGGLGIYNQHGDIFTSYRDRLGDIIISSIIYDEPNRLLYVGSENAGIKILDMRTMGIRSVPGLSSQNIHCLYLDGEKGCLYAGTRFGGIDRIDLATGRVKVWLPRDNVYQVFPRGDSLIVSTNNGVLCLGVGGGEARYLTDNPLVSGVFCNNLYLDSSSRCWISVSEGVFMLNLDTGKEKAFFFDDKGVFGTSHTTAAFEDSKGNFWIGTSGSGLLEYDPESDSFISFNTSNSNIGSNYIRSISESRNGYLLLATSKGFSRFDLDRQDFRNFDFGRSFPVSEIMVEGMAVTGDDHIFVASRDNLVSFSNSRLEDPALPSEIFLLSASVDGSEPFSLLYKDSLRLKAMVGVISVTAVSPDFINPVSFEYRLKGLSDSWISTTTGQPIVYSGLSAGNYELTVRCTDPFSGEELCRDSIGIRVKPRWYATILAKFFYLLAAMAVLMVSVRFLKARSEMARKEELTKSKLQFFTYISHEIRTPVTLIQGQLDGLMQKGNVPPGIYNKMLGIQRNLLRINSLIGELLDFRKQEEQKTVVTLREGNIAELIDRVAVVFREYSLSAGIGFDVISGGGSPVMLWYDGEQMEKVLYNLISNAFKNTDPGGKIGLSLFQTDTNVRIEVSDTGVGIDDEFVPHIFDPFFQVPSNRTRGTGLGLAITKGIVEAHGGTISCRSHKGEGTVFTIILRKGDEHIPEGMKGEAASSPADINVMPDEKFIEQIKASQGEDVRTIMIVEDNAELRDILTGIFAPIYNVIPVKDGLDAMEKLQHDIPDIILSDLMMPGMDGNELCTRVKNNVYTSHVPFVILTAKVAEESMLESLKYGADDFISKPFNAKILVSKCNNLVNTRVRLQQKFTSSREISPEMMATNSIDKEFLAKTARIVNENIANPDFDISAFAREMTMGRTRLFTKIKGVTGLTPNKFITTIRLKTALRMLEDNPEDSISDISYSTGFNSPSYFVRSFKSMYGLTPSAYRASRSKERN